MPPSNHLACVLLNAAMGINITHIPYRAGATIFGTQDLIAGRIDYMSIAAAISQIEGNHRIALRQRVAANRPGAEDK